MSVLSVVAIIAAVLICIFSLIKYFSYNKEVKAYRTANTTLPKNGVNLKVTLPVLAVALVACLILSPTMEKVDDIAYEKYGDSISDDVSYKDTYDDSDNDDDSTDYSNYSDNSNYSYDKVTPKRSDIKFSQSDIIVVATPYKIGRMIKMSGMWVENGEYEGDYITEEVLKEQYDIQYKLYLKGELSNGKVVTDTVMLTIGKTSDLDEWYNALSTKRNQNVITVGKLNDVFWTRNIYSSKDFEIGSKWKQPD